MVQIYLVPIFILNWNFSIWNKHNYSVVIEVYYNERCIIKILILVY